MLSGEVKGFQEAHREAAVGLVGHILSVSSSAQPAAQQGEQHRVSQAGSGTASPGSTLASPPSQAYRRVKPSL